MSTEKPKGEPVKVPTPQSVAEMLTEGDNDYHDGNEWGCSIRLAGNVAKLKITPVDEDGNDLDPVHFRAVVVEGDETPIVLPSGAAADYINGDDGYHWLACGTCEVSLMEVTAGTTVGEMATEIAAHKCAQAANGGEAR